ncbi:hypothetical protein Y032_0617g696 [Ancylostoma ceylanicum]|uniref:Uncharacterized protein n=1 Tax=Ancylostoma ceylanicum TaxID=53326 RepID=A0A016WL43_9BILA|nr:hypothetical protein Y032_0617g696 [Ancylostoma ceylanicum]
MYHREGKRWGRRVSQATLIGAHGLPVKPICLNSNGVNFIIHGLFALDAVRVKLVGVTGGPKWPISVAWSRPFDDTLP